MCSILPQKMFVVIMAIFHLFVTMTKMRLDQKKDNPYFLKKESYVYLIPQQLLKVVVQLPSHLQLFSTPWTAAHQASLSFTISQSFLKLVSIVLVITSNHLNLCHPLLLLSIFPSIRVFSNFQWVSRLHQVAKVLELELQHQSFQWILRTDFL